MNRPCSDVFSAILWGKLSKLWDYPREYLNPFLPLICTAVFHSDGDRDTELPWERFHQALHSLLLDIESVNHIKKYLTLHFAELKSDAVKEQQLIKKLPAGERRGESVLSGVKEGLVTEFEKATEEKRFRIVLSELLHLLNQVDAPFQMNQSDLFECVLFLEEVGHIMSIAVKELPVLLPINKLVEALLRVNNGSYLICCLLANIPESYSKVLKSLILNGESLDEISLAGRVRSHAIQDLVAMHPSQAAYVQWLAYTNQKLPTLMIFIALDNDSDAVNFKQTAIVGSDGHRGGSVLSLISNIVIHGSDDMRAWFAQYMKLMQQKYRRHRESAVSALRKYLMKRLMYFINHNHSYTTSVQGNEMEVELGVGMASGIVEEEEEEKMDTLTMELVDQMEIEISDTDQDDGLEAKTIKAEPHSVKPPLLKDHSRHRRRHSSSFAVDHVVFTSISLSHQFSDDLIEVLSQLLHVLCGLKVQVHMYLTTEETSAILGLITSTCPPFSSAGVLFVKVSLSVLLACPFLISTEEGEQATVRWLQWLLEYLPKFEKFCPGESCYGEMLLLVAMHLQDKKLNQIGKLIQSVLGMKITGTLKSGHFSTLKSLFLKVFNESVVCSHAVNVTPTPNLNDKMTGYLPIHCVHQLIQSKAFRKHGVSIKDWIYGQMCCVSEPLHSLLLLLVEEYVQAILVLPSHSTRNKPDTNTITQVPFTAEEVLSVFACNTGYTPASQIIMLYYVLFYHDCFLANLKMRAMKKSSAVVPQAYSPNVMLQLPVKRLLQYASMNQASFQTLYPSLLRLMVAHFPHLCLTVDRIKEEEILQGAVFKPIIRIPKTKVTVAFAGRVLSKLQSSPTKSLLVLSHLSALPPTSLLPYCSIITSCVPLLLGNVSKHVQQLFNCLWTKLNSVIPRRLWVETVNALRPHDHKNLPLYAHQNLIEDPLIVLKCDPRVFRSPNVFEILLRILASYTAASRVWLSEHAHVQKCMAIFEGTMEADEWSSDEKEELRIALTAAQESAIIQLLLEVCLPTVHDRKEASALGTQLTSLREIQCLVGSYLHQVFIAEPSMVKLVHFQGYPIQLLPMMASGVPSLHIAMDFIPELLQQTQLDKQVFAIQLAANVATKYPLPDAMGLTRSIFKKLDLLVVEVPPKKWNSFFKPILPAVVMFCQTFPPLCTEATAFLLHLSKLSHSSSDISLSTGQVLDTNATKQVTPDCTISQDPVFGMEDKLEYLSSMSLQEGACWAFEQIVKEVVLTVSGKS